MRWKKENISTNRGNFEPVIAKFDNSRYWLRIGEMCSTQEALRFFRMIGHAFGAASVEVKYLFGKNDWFSERAKNIVDISLKGSPKDIRFRQELPVDFLDPKQFKELTPAEVFS